MKKVKEKETTTSTANEPPTQPEDIGLSGFNMEEFRAKPTESSIQRKKKILTIPVGKPNKQLFFRVHPDMEYPAYILDWENEKQSYLIHPSLVEKLANQIKYKILHPAVYSNGTPFLLAVPQPSEDGKWNKWHKSLAEVVEIAKKKWVRVEADQTAQSYNLIQAQGNFGEPIWPDLTMKQYLEIAFKDLQIKNEDHPRIKELDGLV